MTPSSFSFHKIRNAFMERSTKKADERKPDIMQSTVKDNQIAPEETPSEENKPPSYEAQNSKNNLSRFQKLYQKVDYENAAKERETGKAEHIWETRLSMTHEQRETARQKDRENAAEAMVQFYSKKMDNSTKIDWAGFASQYPHLKHHVAEIQARTEALNEQLKVKHAASIRMKILEEVPSHLKEVGREVEERAKYATRVGFMELVRRKMHVGGKSTYQERHALRKRLVDQKLDDEQLRLIHRQRPFIENEANTHPSKVKDEFTNYIQEKNLSLEESTPLMELELALFNHAHDVMVKKETKTENMDAETIAFWTQNVQRRMEQHEPVMEIAPSDDERLEEEVNGGGIFERPLSRLSESDSIDDRYERASEAFDETRSVRAVPSDNVSENRESENSYSEPVENVKGEEFFSRTDEDATEAAKDKEERKLQERKEAMAFLEDSEHFTDEMKKFLEGGRLELDKDK